MKVWAKFLGLIPKDLRAILGSVLPYARLFGESRGEPLHKSKILAKGIMCKAYRLYMARGKEEEVLKALPVLEFLIKKNKEMNVEVRSGNDMYKRLYELLRVKYNVMCTHIDRLERKLKTLEPGSKRNTRTQIKWGPETNYEVISNLCVELIYDPQIPSTCPLSDDAPR
jgi:hypothetical protein